MLVAAHLPRVAGRRGGSHLPSIRLLASAVFLSGVLSAWAGNANALEPSAVSPRAPSCAERLDATYYHRSLTGERMANGQPYDPRNPRLASSNRHRLGTLLLLRRADGAAAITVEVMDRGSAELGVDLSEAAFELLAPLRDGRIPVCVEVIR
jgi:rare lipoprotein A (peptidoglycan hydrolase)